MDRWLVTIRFCLLMDCTKPTFNRTLNNNNNNNFDNVCFSLFLPAVVRWPNGVCGARVTWHVAKGCRSSLGCCSCQAKITRNVQKKRCSKRHVRVTARGPRAKSMRPSQKVNVVIEIGPLYQNTDKHVGFSFMGGRVR